MVAELAKSSVEAKLGSLATSATDIHVITMSLIAPAMSTC